MNFMFVMIICTLTPTLLRGAPETKDQAPATTVVLVTGVGVDADKALRDAFRNAVEQAVGLIVDAETVVANETLIKDQVLTYSDGFVESVKRVKEGKRDDGLYEVKIEAVVRRRQLIERLKEAKISVARVDGGSLYAEIVTKLDSEKSAAKLLSNVLEGLPVNLMVTRLIDAKPDIVQKNETGVRARWTVLVSFDYKKYEQNVLPKLRDILAAAAKRQSASEIKDNSLQRFHGYALTHIKFSMLWGDASSIMGSATSARHESGDINGSNELLVMLNTARNMNGDERRWHWFIIDRATCWPVLKEFMKQEFELRISLINSAGRPMRELAIPFGKAFEDIVIWGGGVTRNGRNANQNWRRATTSVQLPLFIYESYKGGQLTVEVSPFVRTFRSGQSENLYGDVLEYSYEADFTLDEVKEIREIKCSVVDEGAKRRSIRSDNQPPSAN